MPNELNKSAENFLLRIHNDVNKTSFPKFTEQELDMFMTTLSLLSNHGHEEVTLSVDTLMESTGRKRDYLADREQFMKSFFCKSQNATCPVYIVDENGKEWLGTYPFFSSFFISEDCKEIRASINPKFEHFINNIEGNYSAFQLSTFFQQSTKYSKNLFRLLNQYRATGWFYISKEDFNRILDVPTSYQQKYVNSKIIKPSVKELGLIFNNLEYVPKKKGRSIVGYEFKWDKEKHTRKQVSEVDDKVKLETKNLTEDEISLLKDSL